MSETAISKATKRFNIIVAERVGTIRKLAKKYKQRKLTAMDRLLHLADKCGDELEWIETEHPPSNKKDYQTWQDQKLKYTAEIRKLISAMADIRVKIYHVESVEKSLCIILTVVGKASIELQKQIRDELRRAAIDLELGD